MHRDQIDHNGNRQETETQRRRAAAFDRAVDKCREKLRERYLRPRAGKGGGILTIDEIEQIACDLRNELGSAIVQELTQAEADVAEQEERQAQQQKRACRECKRAVPFRGTGKRTIVTMVGEVEVNRRAYYCRQCECCTYPLDVVLRLPEGAFTVQVERNVGWLSAQGPFRSAMGALAKLSGVHVSAKQAERIATEMGNWVQGELQADIERVLPKNPQCVHLRGRRPEAVAEQLHDPKYTGYVFIDGAQTPMKGKGEWRESKMGTVCLTEGRAWEGTKPQVVQRVYTHHLGGPEQLGDQIYTLAAQMGITELARVAVLGDGAVWIWNLAAQHFPHSVQILDWYHAVEYLYGAARLCLVEPSASEQDNAQRVKGWVKSVEDLLWKGQTEEAIQRVQELPTPTAKAQEQVRQTLVYYKNNRCRMQYDQYRAKGYWIGSGMAESACKQIVTARLKGSGMHWTEAGARAIGCLRALFLSGDRWDQLINCWPGRRLAYAPVS